MEEVKIVWAMPNYGPIFEPVYSSHLQCIAYTSRYCSVEHIGKVVGCGATDRLYTHTAENIMVREFLNMDATHLFMTESDMILPKDTLTKLLAWDKDGATGVYFLRKGEGTPCLFVKAKIVNALNPYAHTQVTIFPTDRIFRIDCPGLGCALFKRHVFEKVKHPWFDLKEMDDEGRGWGSDMFFYTHFREAGLEMWADPSVMCGQIEYTTWSYKDYSRRLSTDPTYGSRGVLLGWNSDRTPENIPPHDPKQKPIEREEH